MLWGISWANLLLLSATIPSYKKDDEDNEKPKQLDEEDIESFFGF